MKKIVYNIFCIMGILSIFFALYIVINNTLIVANSSNVKCSNEQELYKEIKENKMFFLKNKDSYICIDKK